MFTGLGTSGIIIFMYVITTIIGQLVIPYGITDQIFVTNMGLFVFAFGIFGGVIASLVLTRYPQKMMLAAYIIAFGSIASVIFFYMMNRRALKIHIYVACSAMGFFLIPILFVAYELAVM